MAICFVISCQNISKIVYHFVDHFMYNFLHNVGECNRVWFLLKGGEKIVVLNVINDMVRLWLYMQAVLVLKEVVISFI